jgi:hypothetical protein
MASFSAQPDADLLLDVPGLRVYAPHPEYVFAIKAVAGHPQDVGDLEALCDRSGTDSANEALGIVTR